MTKFQRITGLTAALVVLCVNNSVDVLMNQSPLMWYVLNAGVVGFITLIIWEIVAERIEQAQVDVLEEVAFELEETKYEPTQEDLDRTLNEAKQSWSEYVSTQEMFGKDWNKNELNSNQ